MTTTWTPAWAFRTPRFTVELSTAPTGDYCWDLDDCTLQAIDDGTLKLFDARVCVRTPFGKPIGEEYLGSCIYTSPEAFRTTDHFRDMVRMACHHARVCLGSVRSHLKAEA